MSVGHGTLRQDVRRRLRSTSGRGRKIKGLLRLMRPYRSRVILMFVALVLGVAASLAPAPLAAAAIDQGIQKQNLTALDWIVAAFVASALIAWGMTYVQTYLTGWVGQRLLQDLRAPDALPGRHLALLYLDLDEREAVLGLSPLAGSGRFDTVVMRHFGPRVFCKVGAEGVYCAALPELGLGVALKIDDAQLHFHLGTSFKQLAMKAEAADWKTASRTVPAASSLWTATSEVACSSRAKMTAVCSTSTSAAGVSRSRRPTFSRSGTPTSRSSWLSACDIDDGL